MTQIYSHLLSPRQRCDLELLFSGAFAPLSGFLGERAWYSVVEEMRLPDGALWPIPITLDIPEGLARRLQPGDFLHLEREDGTPLAQLQVEELYRVDRLAEAQAVYATVDPVHPGVAAVLAMPPWNVAGTLTEWREGGLLRAAAVEFPPEYRRPAELHPLAADGPLLAFQTRNPLHHAHLAVTQAALAQLGENAKLLLHPAIGPTKPGDVDAVARMRAYRAAFFRYPQGTVILSPIPLAMRMAGPREALWHALIRKNHGASHFLVGRAHADPGRSGGGSFYPPFAAQELLTAHQEELGIVPVLMPEYAYSPSRKTYVPRAEANGERLADLSGTELRRRLAAQEEIPEWFSPREVIQILRQAYRGADRRGLVLWFTGLSASGKSTLAGMLARYLEQRDSRAITLLDGDVVRRFLSKGLGFSREDREENIRRIGFVASLVARHGGIALVAAISPYREGRQAARQLVEAAGGVFFEIHVATPLAVCAQRDPKGLYAKAMAGTIAHFTGVDDPYEEPEQPDLRLDTSQQEDREALQILLDFLQAQGVLSNGQ